MSSSNGVFIIRPNWNIGAIKIDPPEPTQRIEANSWCDDGDSYYVPGLKGKGATVTLEGVIGDLRGTLSNMMGRVTNFRLEFPNTPAFEFEGVVSNVKRFREDPIGDGLGGDTITILVNGAAKIIQPVIKEKKVMKVRNKYYVAASHCTSVSEQDQDNVTGAVAFSEPRKGEDTSYRTGGTRGSGHTPGKWTRKDVKDAIAHAEQILDADPNRDHVAIVRIVRIVRRKKAPIVVEIV